MDKVFLASLDNTNLLTDLDHLCLHCSRRIYPGIHIAERKLWPAISPLFRAYEIRSLPDGHTSLEEHDGENGRTPLSYRISLMPRHDRVQALLEAEQEVMLMD